MNNVEFVHVELTNEPGALGRCTALLGSGGVNIQGFWLDGGGVCLWTNDPVHTIEVLDGHGITATSFTALSIDMPNTPGQIGGLYGALGSGGVNVLRAFGVCTPGAPTGTMYFEVDNVALATPIIEGYVSASVETPVIS